VCIENRRQDLGQNQAELEETRVDENSSVNLMHIDLTFYTVFVSAIWFQPALVRYYGLLLFTVGDPNKVLSPDSEKLGLGQGCRVSGVR
jgi:hypothetical protein